MQITYKRSLSLVTIDERFRRRASVERSAGAAQTRHRCDGGNEKLKNARKKTEMKTRRQNRNSIINILPGMKIERKMSVIDSWNGWAQTASHQGESQRKEERGRVEVYAV